MDTKIPRYADLISAHYLGNSINLLLPYKLGEAFRYYFINKCYKNKGILILYFCIFEKILDFILLLAILILLMYKKINTDLAEIFFYEILILTIFILILTILIFIAQKTKKSNPTKNIIQKYNYAIEIKNQARINILKNKFKILTQTFFIWFLEIVAFLTVIQGILDFPSNIIRGILVFISTILPSGPLAFGGSHLAEYWSSLITGIQPDYSQINEYTAVIFFPSLLFGFVLYFSLLERKK